MISFNLIFYVCLYGFLVTTMFTWLHPHCKISDKYDTCYQTVFALWTNVIKCYFCLSFILLFTIASCVNILFLFPNIPVSNNVSITIFLGNTWFMLLLSNWHFEDRLADLILFIFMKKQNSFHWNEDETGIILMALFYSLIDL